MQHLTEILGGEIGKLPTVYLGMPLGAKSKSNEIWNGVLQRCERRLSRWKAQYLSRGGRLTLINSVLDALPTFMMSVFPLPPNVEERIDALRRNFVEWREGIQRNSFGQMEECNPFKETRWVGH